MIPPGSCQGAHWAYATHTFGLDSSGLYTLAIYTRSATCSGCTMYSRVFIDGVQIHNAYDPGPDLHYVSYQLDIDGGAHDLSAGIYTTQMCSGTFQAFHDDFMLARAVTPEPTSVQNAPAPRLRLAGKTIRFSRSCRLLRAPFCFELNCARLCPTL